MALLPSEVQRIRVELGYPAVGLDASPYIAYISIFDQVVVPYLTAGARTTSTTYVPAASSPTVRALTLASATGFSAGALISLGDDFTQETATVQDVVGNVIRVYLKKEHGESGGTLPYAVTVDGGEMIIRELLAKLRAVGEQMGLDGSRAANVSLLTSGGGLKRADDIEWYQGNWANTSGGAMFANLKVQQKHWRNELARALGVKNLNDGGRNGTFAPY